MIVSIILFLIIFCVVVLSHEFGHFIVAKKNGIHVVEFFIGMGPTLFSFKKGDTKYSLKLLPIGGACMFEGEDGLEKEKGEMSERAFPNAPVWVRFATIFAGPLFNFLVAYVMALILVSVCGITTPTVQAVSEGGSAEKVGLQESLRIRKYGCTAPVVLCYLIFNGVYDQALFVFPIDFHIDMVAPVARKHSLSPLSDLEDHTVNFAVPVYINKGIATKRSLIAHDDLGIVLSGGRSYRLYNRVMNKDRYNTADETNR